jgi:predicted dehydrogenase
MEVEDNAVIILGHRDRGPWAMFHASWTEWKNQFSLEIFCQTAKLQVDGLTGSYGPQRLSIYSMKPELGPPDLETIEFPSEDESWSLEWQELAGAVHGADGRPLAGDLASAGYGWKCVEAAYARTADE